ncbi:response regulator [Actinoplanes sp. NPDC023801]|uniref:response regulator n=1 Tax=Actinoplanes sp. NPDC023801 TaxID=3154595 RepID=UPI0034008BB3
MSTILVVDDEPDLRFLLRRILTRAGYQVAEAGNGAVALEEVRRVRPDLVVTDMMMPVMAGPELIQRLRADPCTASIPILSVSSDWQLAVDADAALGKPYERAELLEIAERLLKEGRDGQ